MINLQIVVISILIHNGYEVELLLKIYWFCVWTIRFISKSVNTTFNTVYSKTKTYAPKAPKVIRK